MSKAVAQVAGESATSKEVATTGGTAQLPAHMQGIDEYAGLGNSQDSRDSVMPFLAILQKGSPQVNEMEPQYIPGAKAGMLLNTATKEIFDGKEGIVVIPCGFQKNYVEWKPQRGGYVATHPFDVDFVKNKLGARKEIIRVDGSDREVILSAAGNLIVETSYTFVIRNGMPMVIGASSTGLGPTREWNTYRKSQRNPASGKQLASWAKMYRVQTVYNKNEKGDWYNWKFTDEGWVLSDGDFHQAQDFGVMIAKGEVVVGRPPDEFASSDSSSQHGDDGIPV